MSVEEQLIFSLGVAAFSFAVGLVLFLAILRTSISTARTARRLEETNALLRALLEKKS